jgi:hypothetical protein
MIAWRVGPDPARVASLFAASGLVRDKWAKRAGYRESTLRKAIEGCNGRFYTATASRPQTAPPPTVDDIAGVIAEDEDVLDVSQLATAVQVLTRENAALREEVAGMRDALTEERRRGDQARAMLAKTLAVRRNPAIKAERDVLQVAILDAAAQASNGHADPEGWVRQPAARVADSAGKAVQTTRKHLERGEAWALFDRRLVEEPDPQTGGRRTVYEIRLKDEPERLLDRLITLDPDRGDKEDWGGKRTPCPRCGSTKTRTVTYCGECDLVLKETRHDGELDDELPTDAAGNIAPIPVETLADPDATYPPAIVAEAEGEAPKLHMASMAEAEDGEADDWNPYWCNHPGCTRRLVIGQRYCGEHRHNYESAPPVEPRPIPFTADRRAAAGVASVARERHADPDDLVPPAEDWYEPPSEAPGDEAGVDPPLPFVPLRKVQQGGRVEYTR